MVRIDQENLGSFDVLSLPSVLISEYSSLPSISVVYFVIDSNDEILYIGKASSQNGLRQRWKSHHKAIDLLLGGANRIAYWEVEPSRAANVERELIRRFNPKFNKSRYSRRKATNAQRAFFGQARLTKEQIEEWNEIGAKSTEIRQKVKDAMYFQRALGAGALVDPRFVKVLMELEQVTQSISSLKFIAFYGEDEAIFYLSLLNSMGKKYTVRNNSECGYYDFVSHD